MHRPLFVMLLAIACSDPGPPDLHSDLQTSASTYAAADDPDPRFDYAVTVIVTHRNTSDFLIRVTQCSATITHARFIVDKVGSGDAAWNPDYTCPLTAGIPYKDLLPGAERTDTLHLRAPWQRSFNGQPIGDIEGTFYLVYETQICTGVSASGACTPLNKYEYVRSNTFTVTVP